MRAKNHPCAIDHATAVAALQIVDNAISASGVYFLAAIWVERLVLLS